MSVEDAAHGKDLVVVDDPTEGDPTLPSDLFADAPPELVVVDTANYSQRDGRIEAIEQGTPESVWVAQQLRRPVVKAFNNIMAQHLLELGRPAGSPDRIALPVAGDDRRRRPSCSGSSTNSASTRSTPAD